MAIQRNFEGLSSMLKKEKDLGSDNKKKVMTLTEENTKLAEENRLLLRRLAIDYLAHNSVIEWMI